MNSSPSLAVVLGASADIGRKISEMLLADGHSVVGTYRRDFPEQDELARKHGMTLVQADLTDPGDVQRFADQVGARGQPWKFLFSSVGSSEPIGRFFELDFESWGRSININFTSQLRAIHALYPHRDRTGVVDVGLLAGGGTNNPFRCYSAYCVAKVGLIKMCELLDDEAEDLNIFILGPGFVRTKTHYETLQAGNRAEENLERVREFMEAGVQGTRFEDIYECLRWSREKGRGVVGGRNLSVVHDPWGSELLAAELGRDREMFKLRRARNGFMINEKGQSE
jgi:NAD(P)-dependent dehydrogenase (short-subunit alcohol dehydrogenase family)